MDWVNSPHIAGVGPAELVGPLRLDNSQLESPRREASRMDYSGTKGF